MCRAIDEKFYPTDLVDEILLDLKSRSGFDHLFDSLDADIVWEIRNEWMRIAEQYMLTKCPRCKEAIFTP